MLGGLDRKGGKVFEASDIYKLAGVDVLGGVLALAASRSKQIVARAGLQRSLTTKFGLFLTLSSGRQPFDRSGADSTFGSLARSVA